MRSLNIFRAGADSSISQQSQALRQSSKGEKAT